MPMIGHQTVRKHRHVTAVDCLKENAFERGVVVGAFEQWNFLRGSIHEMECEARRRGARSSRHIANTRQFGYLIVNFEIRNESRPR